MKKILLIALLASLTLTACNKQEAPKDTPAQSEQNTANMDGHDQHHNHDKNDQDSEHKHHDGHDHAGHDHSHAQGDAYQCGDKVVHIAIHDHDGEKEAHLTSDNITYDLNEDVQTKGRYTTDDGIAGEDKGMALTISGNSAKITTLDDKVLLDCTKQ